MPATTLIDETEELAQSAADWALDVLLNTMIPSFGDRPYGSPAVGLEDQALLFLPEWFTYGQAADEVGAAYWAFLEQQLNEGQVFAWSGERDLLAFDREMRRLYERFPHKVVEGMTPELAQALATLMAAGLHSGHIRPPVDAERLAQVPSAPPASQDGQMVGQGA